MKILSIIIEGTITSIVFAVLVYLLQQLRYYLKIRRHFHNVQFETFYKRHPNKIIQTVNCTVSGNVIKFKGISHNSNPEFSGEIIVNILNLKVGEGHHTHNGVERFGFSKVIIRDPNTILMDVTYIDMIAEREDKIIGHLKSQAFIWRKKAKKK